MRRAKSSRTEEGLTLLESLVAIMVIAIVITAITPAMLVAFATRVQNYKTQNAIQIAQGEIERVRLLVETGSYPAGWTQQLPPRIADANNGYNLDSVQRPAAPDANPPACPLKDVQPGQVTRWCTVDINDDGSWDLGVQTFRTATPSTVLDVAPKQEIAFRMGVRVYTRAALQASPSSLAAAPARKISGLGLTSGESLSHPLVTRYETIVRSDLSISKYAYCELIANLPASDGGKPLTTCNN